MQHTVRKICAVDPKHYVDVDAMYEQRWQRDETNDFYDSAEIMEDCDDDVDDDVDEAQEWQDFDPDC